MFIEEFVTIPKQEYDSLKQLIIDLQAQVKSLQEEIRLLKNGKNSNTSHTSPSQDIGRSNQKSLRVKSDKKTGGQQGHEGSTLEMRSAPDEVIDYRANYCSICSNSLTCASSIIEECKQEIVIPPIQVQCIEHRSHSRVCPN